MRTKEQDTQYQRDRRAKLPKIIDLGQSVVGGTVREYKGVSGYRYLPGDHVIGNMTQKQRDLIISRLPKTPRAR